MRTAVTRGNPGAHDLRVGTVRARRLRSGLMGPPGFLALVAAAFLALAAPAAAQDTRTVTGVVVDAESGVPVSDAVVAIAGTDRSAITDQDGRFEISAVPLGDRELVLRHVAYGEQTEPLVVGGSGALDFRILVSSRAIELEPLDVEVRSPEASAQRALGTAGYVVDRATIDAVPSQGRGLLPVLQSRIPSLRVEGQCVEYRFQQQRVFVAEDGETMIEVPCRDITVYVDGMPQPRGSELLQRLSPQDVERIQVLSPAEAGVQYASGSRGVILVELREGAGRDSPYRIHVNGFGWNEPQPYPWLRVLGGSAVGNALVVGIATNTVLECGGEEDPLQPRRCHAMAGATAALLTGLMGPVITRLVGRTQYSEGRTYPTLLTAVATASIGYLLYVHGEKQDSDASRVAGRIVLGVGIPISLTLSNRVFRMLR